MEKEYIDKLAWICIQNKKLLITRSKGKDAYFIPGGAREEGETDHEALIREIKEELTVDLVSKTIERVGTYEAQAYGKPDGSIVRMTCYRSDFRGDIQPDSEIEEVAWFEYKDRSKGSQASRIVMDDLFKKRLII